MNTTIKASQLLTLLTGAGQGISTHKDTKHLPAFNTVHLELSNGTLTATATDRYVMARGTVTGLPIFSGDRSVNLTAPTIKAIAQLLKPLKDQAVTIIFGTGAVTGLTIGYDKPALATSQGFDGVTLDYGYPDITKLIPNEFAGLDSEGIILDPAVMGKACKVTPALIKWQLNGALKSVYGTAQDTCGINWQIMVMPCRMI